KGSSDCAVRCATYPERAHFWSNKSPKSSLGDVRLHNCRVSYNSQFCWGIEKKILHNFLKEDMWHEQLSWVQAWLVWQPLGICKNVAMTSKLLTARASQLVRHGAMQVG